MWRRTYLLLILVRLYFALSPSYLHPDENFQGPEVVAGQIFTYPVHPTWEFTSAEPIRSVFPLWPIYGLPMLLLRWVWNGSGKDDGVTPSVVYWTLRALMFLLSFVMEDWAIQELIQSPRHRRMAVLLVASSYVTWTYQTHTFSNSIETLLVAWSLVLIQRITANKQRSSIFSSGLLGFLFVFGTFNRITFPAFLLIPGLHMVPHFLQKPLSLTSTILFAVIGLFLAIYADTAFYLPGPVGILAVFRHPIITPLNNLLYNSSFKNLAQHGIHPYYQHILVNLPQLLGPAFPLLFLTSDFNLRLKSALSGVVVLSFFRHQEARFLIPTVPLILSSIQLPRRYARLWIAAWIGFNAIFGILTGVYHQGGVIPTQTFLAGRADATEALWWRCYSPPTWLLGGKNERLNTRDLKGMEPSLMIEKLHQAATCHETTVRRANAHPQRETKNGTYLIAPLSSTYLDQYTHPTAGHDLKPPLAFEKVWEYRNHLNLDDMDFAEDGVWQTLTRVVGRRGLAAWRVTKAC
ncbi:MAG: alpha 1,2 mannosyltransferase [Geoglossum umbratile]|nr:MAG: alpha 1,2 mannosyltransferase [Geoglossum umbratile]